ncbi:MAG: hypothetical protein LBU25_03265 [Treponema sp.]|nr:hypothetical protein [Treponema sp.]
MQAVLQGTPYFFRSRDASVQGDMFFTSVPFAIGKTRKPWSLSIGLPFTVVSLAMGVLGPQVLLTFSPSLRV